MIAASYFERSGPIALIFGSFLVVFLPLCVLSVVPNFAPWLPYLVLFEAVGLGTSHFFITLAVYFRREELAYFASTAKNRVVYFAVPLLILLLFALVAAGELRTRAPVFAAYLFGALRFLDFFHVGRQSFGMLQIWRRPVASEAAPWWRRAENAFFVGMALLQWETFALGGRLRMDVLHMALPAAAMFVLFGTLLTSYLQRAARTGAAGRRALTYFVMQAVCAGAAAYETRLYLIALTLHYVEYHVIIAPRILRASGAAKSPAVSGRAFLSSPWVVYPLLLGVVVTFELRNAVGSVPATTAFFVHIFDGIFFVHYFVEAFLWKFGNPHYRELLGPLYFSPRAQTVPPTRRSRLAPALAVGVIAVALLVAQAEGGLARAGADVTRYVIGPIHADNHTRWGLDLAQNGELTEAREHLEAALAHQPSNPQARALRAAVERELVTAGRHAPPRPAGVNPAGPHPTRSGASLPSRGGAAIHPSAPSPARFPPKQRSSP